VANLLTQIDKKVLARRDILTIVFVYILGGLFIMAVGLVFLVPSYFLSQYKLEGVENRLDLLKASISAKKNEETSSALSQTRLILGALQEESSSQTLGGTVVDLISKTPSAVYLNNFSVKRNLSAEDGLISLSIDGEASTRKQLLEFTDILKNDPRFKNVNLPISVLAKEKDIIFSLSFVLNTKEIASSDGL